MSRFKVNLTQVTISGLTLVILLMALLYIQLSSAAEEAVNKGSALLLELNDTTELVEDRVRLFFAEAEQILEEVAETESLDLMTTPDSKLSDLLMNKASKLDDISEVTFTWERGQISVFRDSGGELQSQTRLGPEPAQHRTYATLAQPRLAGRAIWSDLHYSQLGNKQGDKNQVVVTVQKAIRRRGKLLGVVRVGRTTTQLDLVQKVGNLPGWLFLCDEQGRRITRFEESEALVENEDAFRYASENAPPAVREALRQFGSSAARDRPNFLSKFRSNEEPYVVSFRALKGSQDWYVGMVWPESHFLQSLVEAKRMALLTLTLVVLALMTLTVGLLRLFHGDLSRLVKASTRMQDLDFEANDESFRISEVEDVSTNLEGAKATLRAVSKYIPIDLVRQLFSQDLKPELGGSAQQLSLMFTDVADFTTISEALTTDELAQDLAVYLQQMDAAIEVHEGNVLERMGDALLVIWNAPAKVEQHSLKACRAALECVKATKDNPWSTRFGLHCDQVMVGHFGSENRMNYGILGDGVNLASRIEGLNKHYGTTILVTAAVAQQCQEELCFRAVDRVSVKGKAESVEVLELLGAHSEISSETRATREDYEKALELYRKHNFEQALRIWENLGDDPPSRVMAARCQLYLTNSPGDDWDGTFRPDFK